jgi:hypothetical protein
VSLRLCLAGILSSVMETRLIPLPRVAARNCRPNIVPRLELLARKSLVTVWDCLGLRGCGFTE